MRVWTQKWLGGGLLALGLCLLTWNDSIRAEAEDKKAAEAAQKAILDLSQGKGNAKQVAEKNTLDHVMRGFKLKTKGGIAVDGFNGIEAKVISLAKTPLTKDQLTKESAGLIKMAEI